MNQPADFPFRIESPAGLSIQVNANGSIRRMDFGDILLNLYLGTEIEGGPANLYLRRHGRFIESVPLLGPCSPAAFAWDKREMTACGEWRGIRFRVSLIPSQSSPAWFWHVVLENTGPQVETVDLLYTQDLALAHYGAVRLNEYYVCHYVDHTPLTHPEKGFVVASRQNLSMGGRNPWSVIGSLGKGISYATDGLQFHGLSTRAGLTPIGLKEGLPGSRLQHEHSMVAIQDAPIGIEPGAVTERGFFGWFEADHPAASSAADLKFVDAATRLAESRVPRSRSIHPGSTAVGTLFSSAPMLQSLDLTEGEITDLFGGELREQERLEGKLLSFFTNVRRHVVLKAKELQVLRPHAHILRTGSRLVPDEASLTSTTWMGGVFHSMVTQGHVSINRFLSTVHSYLSLFRGNGQRLFVEIGGTWRLLDVPSAYEMSPQFCRWIYRHSEGMIVISSRALTQAHELTLLIEVLSGPPARFFLANHMALNGDDGSDSVPVPIRRVGETVFVEPLPDTDIGRRFPQGGFRIAPLPGTVFEKAGGDELLFPDNRSRNQPFLCMITAPATSFGFRLKGALIIENSPGEDEKDEGRFWAEMTHGLRLHPPLGSSEAGAAARIGEILPWFIHNGLIHYLAPRGIEQYTGGGWGTRDITQGAVEMMLGMGRFEPLRDLLIRVFKAQNPDGDWPQWFMFFDRERNIRPSDSHGDIVFWPLLALANYLTSSEDRTLLDEQVPFFHPEGGRKAERGTLWHHVERALKVIVSRLIPNTHLAALGNGDWNDSLQPVQAAMREHLCSTWTVTLHYQTLVALAKAMRRFGSSDVAANLEAKAAEVREDFRRTLLVDGILTGYAYFQDDGRIDYLLHPKDRQTGLSYSLLPMIHAIINDLLSPQEADRHLGIIRKHLLGPDGARLFDRPLEYRGGPQRFFQRAESASFFGREIGLMYMHAHLRYAEALARYGDAEGFFAALCKANPIGLQELVPTATLRQSNCYYSSSDAGFADRYQAGAEYERVVKGEVPLEGGWRVYSSGAGIWTSLVLQCFLGIRPRKSFLVLDPVIPQTLDGLRIDTELAGGRVEVIYHIAKKGCGPLTANLNGTDLPFTRGINPYRTGAAEIPMKAVRERMKDSNNRLDLSLG
jgi:cellobiose phosphorylase